MSRQLEVELTVTPQSAQSQRPRNHTPAAEAHRVCVWTKICRPRTVLRSEVRTGTRDWDLGAEKLLTYLRAALLAARRATAVVVFSYLDGRLSSRGVPRQLIYTGFCARLHATRSEHQSTYNTASATRCGTRGQLLHSASAFRPLERDQCCQMVAPRPSGGAVHKAIPSYRTQLSPESADSCGKTCVPAASSSATTVKRTVACKSCLPALMSAGAYARRRQLACLSEPMPDLA